MLKDTIEKDFITAFKSKNEIAVSTLRMLKAAIKNKEIEIGKSLDDAEVIKIASNQVKQRKDAAAEYEKGGRPESAEKEKEEIKVIEKYLPPQLSVDEIRAKVLLVIDEIGATSPADMGQVMGKVMPSLGGAADGNVVSSIVKEELSKK